MVFTVIFFAIQDKKKKPKQEGEEKDDGFLDPDDPFANQDAAEQEKMEAIAKAFEEKYVSYT